MGRTKFSQQEIKTIRMLLGKKCAGTRFQQKEIRHTLRTEFEFNISDFGEQGKAFGPDEFDVAISRGAIKILDDATIEAMKEKRERDRERDLEEQQRLLDEQTFTEVTFLMYPCTEEYQDILCAVLSEQGYDSFEYTDTGIKAYIQASLYTEPEVDIEGLRLEWKAEKMEEQDWNAQWEQNSFDPVLERDFGIKLDPHMAFGSGSHETTYQLVSLLMSDSYKGKKVLDMGTGTGVLGIAMAKRGADKVLMIDIDINSVNNANLNGYLNEVSEHCYVQLGDANTLDNPPQVLEEQEFGEMLFDTIVANIHKNILLRDMPTYVRHLNPGGTLYLSGFFSSDVPDMKEAIETNGLQIVNQYEKNDWTVLKTLFPSLPLYGEGD